MTELNCNLGRKCWKSLLPMHFSTPHPCAMLTSHLSCDISLHFTIFDPWMGVPEPFILFKFYVFKNFPTICPRLWIGKATSCSKISQKVLQKTRSADQSYLYLGENKAKMWSYVTNNKVWKIEPIQNLNFKTAHAWRSQWRRRSQQFVKNSLSFGNWVLQWLRTTFRDLAMCSVGPLTTKIISWIPCPVQYLTVTGSPPPPPPTLYWDTHKSRGIQTCTQ